MERKDFIKTCGFACLGGIGVATLLESCGSLKSTMAEISGSDLVVPLSDFTSGGQKSFKKYIVVNNDLLKYPVCIYRHSETSYSALWMRCTHQGTELQVFGDKLQCPAHGSEFTNRGEVQGGPADIALRTFPVTIDNDRLKISLKAV
jgi:Rieske Fe-S protein